MAAQRSVDETDVAATPGALIMLFDWGLHPPHGGIFVMAIPATTAHVSMYALSIDIGMAVFTTMPILLKQPTAADLSASCCRTGLSFLCPETRVVSTAHTLNRRSQTDRRLFLRGRPNPATGAGRKWHGTDDMLHTPMAWNGMVTAPHHLAARAGTRVLEEGGSAIEAMVAAAAMIAVVYPHMNAIGGDGFWLIRKPGQAPVAIMACGRSAAAATIDSYRADGFTTIPPRGPRAALTVAGTISGWQAALDIAAVSGGRMPLRRLLEDAIAAARRGVIVTDSQRRLAAEKLDQLVGQPGFAEHFLIDGQVPVTGAVLAMPALAATLERLADAGLEDFYRGDLAATIAADLQTLGSPIRRADLAAQRADVVAPLTLTTAAGTLYNVPPPTQGLVSLITLGVFERLANAAPLIEAESFAHHHALIEATKQAILIRDAHVTDPDYMDRDPLEFLAEASLDALAARIDPMLALPWPVAGQAGDTIWMGAIDNQGRAVSFIQSLFFEYGSGVVLPQTGIVWQNRGVSFSLDPSARNPLTPGRRPFHTLNPAMAELADGRLMVYGTMGGDGQPQTQAQVFSRYSRFGWDLQAAVTAPRWRLGRTWGEVETRLLLEDRFDPALIAELRAAGHDVAVTEAFAHGMGHAGGVVRWPDGRLEGATDPRSDGAVAAF